MKLLACFSLYYFSTLQKYLKKRYLLENIYFDNFIVSLKGTKEILLSILLLRM